MKAPEIKHYINWLGRVEYRNINRSFTYDETSYAAIDRVFHLLHRLEPGPENTSWELWLRAERGSQWNLGKQLGLVRKKVDGSHTVPGKHLELKERLPPR